MDVLAVLANCLSGRSDNVSNDLPCSKSAQALLRKVRRVPLDNLLSKSTFAPSLESTSAGCFEQGKALQYIPHSVREFWQNGHKQT